MEKVLMKNFLLYEVITSAFPKLLGNCSWVLGHCMSQSYETISIVFCQRKGKRKTKQMNARVLECALMHAAVARARERERERERKDTIGPRVWERFGLENILNFKQDGG
jgi:hypothetical protein